MKYIRSLCFVALAAVAGLFSALPVPPWGLVAEGVSSAVAFLTFCCMLFLPRFQMRRKTFAFFVGFVPVLRVLAELTWDVVPLYVPREFFLLARVLGADGEGSYNSNSYQVFLVLVAVALLTAALMPSNNSIESGSPAASAHL